MSEHLGNIDDPADLRALSESELPDLCQEIREFLLENVFSSGGHLSTNLGSVELTVALHYVFDFLEDRLIFDVGHQAYTHKILTGRRDRFPTQRSSGGLSGFTNPRESEYDHFMGGHAGTAISTALGLAAAIAPLSGLGAIVQSVQGNHGPILDTMDMLMGMLMPGMMTVDPTLLNPGAGGIPQA